MKRNRFLIVSIFLITLVCIFTYTTFILNNDSTSIDIINSNWDINLPKDGKEVYCSKPEDSFLGDGLRYSVIDYNTNEILTCLNWEDTTDKSLEASINTLITDLDIPIEFTPNFEDGYKHYTLTEDDSSVLYIIFSNSKNRLYLLEDIH